MLKENDKVDNVELVKNVDCHAQSSRLDMHKFLKANR